MLWLPLLLCDGLQAANGRLDPVMGHLKHMRRIFEWHGDPFDLPDGAVHLATSETCAHQAFRYGHNVYGFQFHMEVDAALVERWLNTPIYQTEIAQTEGRVCPDIIRQETAEHIAQLNTLSTQVFGEFLKLMGDINRITQLGSL